ncbi:hypothetical protein [Streptomyces sp. NPDC058861]|uniref:hypothetical protein n=1 Tax=Streptomyces sp. NPDC058861 TaxID=3346653 RepID=UPI00368CCE7A
MLVPPQPERMCEICFNPLNAFVNLDDLSVEYIHQERVEGWNHDPVPVPKDERLVPQCDFCGQPGGTAHFRTRKTVVMRAYGLTRDMGDDWAACERCAPHVRSGAVHLLIDRAVDVSHVTNRPERRDFRRAVKALHMKVMEAEPREITPGKEPR